MGGGGSSPAPARTPIIAPDSVRSQAIFEVVDEWGWGEIDGFPEGADPLEYVCLDGTPIKSSGTLNFQGVTFDYRLGTQDQTYIPGTVDDVIGSPEIVDTPVTHATPITRTVTDPNTDAVRIVVTFSGLVAQNTTTGDKSAATVNLSIEIRPAGGQWTVIDLQGRGTVRDKTDSRYQRSYQINLRTIAASATSYDIRVSRLSADPDSSENSAFRWSSYDKLTFAKLRRPNIAYCRLTFDTRYFSTVPTRSYKLRGWKIQVPDASVYDPVARTYSQADWSGNLVMRWSRNPAWVLHHLLTTGGIGLGDDINPAYQDRWAIYNIARRCDERVPDGKGGTEPRYSIDAQFMTQVSAHEMIQQIAGVFDAQALWDGKAVYLTQDAPKPVSALYLPANVVGGRFVYAGTAKQTRYTAALIQYSDPTDQYRLTTEYIEDFDGIQRYGYRPKTETAIGCTSRSEAHRRGKRLLVTSRAEIKSVTFSVGLDGMVRRPGDIMRIADPLHTAGQRMGGRISTGSTSSAVNLDAPVTLGAGSYRLAIISADGTVIDSAITNITGTHSTITVSPSFGQIPEHELEWIVYDPITDSQLFRVLGISENEDKSSGFYTISATQYAPGKFAEIDDIADLPQLPANPYIVGGVIPPSGVQTSEGIYTGLEGFRRYIDISWTASNDPLLRGYILSYKHNGTQIFEREISGQSYRIDNPLMGDYEITLSAISITGRHSTSITITHTLGEFYLIAAVSIVNLQLPSGTGEFTGRDALFSWQNDAATVLSSSYASGQGGQSPWFRDYEVRIYNGNVLVRTDYVTESHYAYTFERNIADGGPRRTFTAKVRARDYYGRYSQEAQLTATNPPPVDFGAVTLTPALAAIFVTYIQPTDPDYQYTRIYASTSQGFAPSDANLVGETTDRVTSFSVDAPGIWYLRLQGIDAFGIYGAIYSIEISTTVFVTDITAAVDEVLADPGRTGDVIVEADRFLIVRPGQLSPQESVFGVGQVDGQTKAALRGDLLIDGSIYARSIGAGQVTAEKITVTNLSAVAADMGTLTAGTIRTSPLTGWRAELSSVGDYPIWYGQGAKTAENGRFYLDKTGNAFFSGVLSGATGTFSGSLSAATGTFSGALIGGSINVNSRFTVDTDGTTTIRDATGTVILSTGTGVPWSAIASGGGRPENNANYITNTNQLSDGAGLGATATWTGVSGAGKPANNATLNASSGNLLVNAGMYLGLDTWIGGGLNLPGWCLRDSGIANGTAWVSSGGPADPTMYIYKGVTDAIPVTPGQILEFFAYTGAHRCTVSVSLRFEDSAGSSTGLSYSSGNAGIASGGSALSGYMRLGGFATVPAGSARARFHFEKGSTYTGQSDSYGFMTMPYVGVANPNQTEFSDWSDGASGAAWKITPANASTYIAELAVDTLQIAGNAVTIPGYAEGVSTATIVLNHPAGTIVLIKASATIVLTSPGAGHIQITIDGVQVKLQAAFSGNDIGAMSTATCFYYFTAPTSSNKTYAASILSQGANGIYLEVLGVRR